MVATARAKARSETAVATLGDLQSRGGLRGADIANIVDVSPPTVSRWSNGKGLPSLHIQTVIADLRYVVERLSDFYSPDETRLWLQHLPSAARARAPRRFDPRRPDRGDPRGHRSAGGRGVPVGVCPAGSRDLERRDGIIAPSARSPCLNLVLFVDHLQPDDLELVDSSRIDGQEWNRRRRGEE